MFLMIIFYGKCFIFNCISVDFDYNKKYANLYLKNHQILKKSQFCENKILLKNGGI